jgi:hypothetical protein
MKAVTFGWPFFYGALPSNPSCYHYAMAPTVFRQGAFRFFFFSREESRMHVHVSHTDGEAKFWIEPALELALSSGLSPAQLRDAMGIVQEHSEEIRDAWHMHFGR